MNKLVRTGILAIFLAMAAAWLVVWGQGRARSERSQSGPKDTLAMTSPARARAHVTRSPGPAADSAPWAFAGSQRPSLTPDAPAHMSAETIYRAMRERLLQKRPDLGLSDQDVWRMSEALTRVRAVQERLHELPYTADNAEAIRQGRARIADDLRLVAEIAGMSASELTDALGDQGLTTEDTDHEEEIIYEPLPRAPLE